MTTTIRVERAIRRISQQDLANALHIDRSTVAKWETGAAFPTGKKLPDVAKALNCEIEELFRKEEKKGREPQKKRKERVSLLKNCYF